MRVAVQEHSERDGPHRGDEKAEEGIRANM
jgi:hypothetical protein